MCVPTVNHPTPAPSSESGEPDPEDRIDPGCDLTVPDTVTGVNRPLLRRLPVVLAVAASLIVAACGGSESSFPLPAGAEWKAESGKSVNVEAQDNLFVPQFIQVKKGAKVTFANNGRNRHNVLASEQGSFEDIQVDQFDPGMSASRTFDKTGEFGFYCSLHGTRNKGMYGAIKVVD